jgi:hypothetical protein
LIFLLLIFFLLDLVVQNTIMHLSKERRGLLNNIMNREISERERYLFRRIQAEQAAEEAAAATETTPSLHIPTGKVTTMTFYSRSNPFYHQWTIDKDRAQWYPLKFDKDVANANGTIVTIRTFSTNFINAMDALHCIMTNAKCITDREYEQTYKRVFSASYSIGRFYFEWEKTHFGVTKVCDKWHNSVLNE